MRLVLKLPQNKLPFIGVQFQDVYNSSRMNADLFWLPEQRPCKIVMELNGKNSINLKLICEELNSTRLYKQLDFDPDKLRTWLIMTERAKEFNFSHVIMRENKHIVARVGSTEKNFVLKLDSV